MWGQGHPKRSPSLLPICLGPGWSCRQQDMRVTQEQCPHGLGQNQRTDTPRCRAITVNTQDRQVVLTNEVFHTQGTLLSLGQ